MKQNVIVRWTAVALNLLNAIFVTISIVSFFTGSGEGNMTVSGANCFRYFTIDSNILGALTSLAVIPFLFRKKVPDWVLVLKFVGTVAVTVTFLTVVFFLGPTQGYDMMFEGVCLYLHLICPLLAIASIYLPEIGKPLPAWSWLFGVLPVVIYSFLYIVMVLINCVWEDFYGFNAGGLWYISLVAMLLFSVLLSLGMSLLQRKRVSKSK